MDTRIYDSLARRSKAGEILFRIWQHIDDSSAMPSTARPSPRGSPTGEPPIAHPDATPKDGFSADNPYFQNMSPAAFDAIKVDLRPSSRTVWIQESVIRQVKGDLAWIDRSVARDVQLNIPEPPHSRRHSHSSSRHGVKTLRLPTRPPTVIDEDAASVSMATEATAGSLIDLDDPETNVMDELASVFSDSVSVSTARTPVPLRQAASRQDEGDEAAQSPWIVGHGNLDWAIHRITRILTRNPVSKVHLTVVRQDELSIERSTGSAAHLEILKNSQQRGSAERQTLIEAERFAKNSMEVLFYGRIFAESCETIYTWTSKVSFEIQSYVRSNERANNRSRTPFNCHGTCSTPPYLDTGSLRAGCID